MVLEKMPKLGCVSNGVTYGILIKGLCSNCRTALDLQLLLKMVKHGGDLEPDVVTYSMVIDGLCKQHELAKAFALCKQMHSSGVIPDIVTYSSLMNGLCKKGSLDQAEEFPRFPDF